MSYSIITYKSKNVGNGPMREVKRERVATIEEARDEATAIVQDAMDSFSEDRDVLRRYGFLACEEAALDASEDGAMILLPNAYVIHISVAD